MPVKISAAPPHDSTRLGVLCQTLTHILLHVAPIFTSVFWVFLGAFTFHVLERENGRTLSNWTERIGEFFRSTDDDAWSFWNSVAYSLSLQTAVGNPYRHPRTSGGQLASCTFLLTGFPLYVVALLLVGQGLSKLITLFCGLTCRACCNRRRWKRLRSNNHGRIPFVKFPLCLSPLLLTGLFALFALLIHCCEVHRDLTLASYAECLAMLFDAFSTLGIGVVPPSGARGEIVVLSLAALLWCCVAATVHLIKARVVAVLEHICGDINERYRRARLAPDSASMPTDRSGVNNGLRVIKKLQTCGDRGWFALFGDDESLRDAWLARASMRNSETQSRECSFEPRMYGVGSSVNEFRKSRDDVNSLVAMLDYGLRPSARRWATVEEEPGVDQSA